MKKKNAAPEVLYQDPDLIILNKPPGILSIPDRFVPDKPNLLHQLQEMLGEVWVVHRLDRETSGAICFARNAEAHRHLSLQFEQRQVNKYYWAVVDGLLSEKKGTIDRPIAPHPSVSGKMVISKQGKPSLTHYQVLEEFQFFSLVEADIRTGRTHQIRVHFESLGHPLVVDELYGKREALFLSEIKRRRFRLGKNEAERPLFRRLSLHARRLLVEAPGSGERLEVEAPPPKDFRAMLNQMAKWLGK